MALGRVFHLQRLGFHLSWRKRWQTFWAGGKDSLRLQVPSTVTEERKALSTDTSWGRQTQRDAWGQMGQFFILRWGVDIWHGRRPWRRLSKREKGLQMEAWRGPWKSHQFQFPEQSLKPMIQFFRNCLLRRSKTTLPEPHSWVREKGSYQKTHPNEHFREARSEWGFTPSLKAWTHLPRTSSKSWWVCCQTQHTRRQQVRLQSGRMGCVIPWLGALCPHKSQQLHTW